MLLETKDNFEKEDFIDDFILKEKITFLNKKNKELLIKVKQIKELIETEK